MLSLPPGTEMFQFPGFPVLALCVQARLTGHDSSRVSPFGNPWIYGWLAPTQGLSQLPTSFVGSRSLGIHRMPFLLAVKMLALAMEFSRIRSALLGRGPLFRRKIRRPTSSSATRGSRGVCDEKDRSFRAARGAQRISQRPSAWSRLTYRSTRPRCRHTRRHARCGSPPRRRSLCQKLNSQWFTWCLRVSRRTDVDEGTASMQTPERR